MSGLWHGCVACVWLNVWPGYNLFAAYLEDIAWTVLWASLMLQLV